MSLRRGEVKPAAASSRRLNGVLAAGLEAGLSTGPLVPSKPSYDLTVVDVVRYGKVHVGTVYGELANPRRAEPCDMYHYYVRMDGEVGFDFEGRANFYFDNTIRCHGVRSFTEDYTRTAEWEDTKYAFIDGKVSRWSDKAVCPVFEAGTRVTFIPIPAESFRTETFELPGSHAATTIKPFDEDVVIDPKTWCGWQARRLIEKRARENDEKRTHGEINSFKYELTERELNEQWLRTFDRPSAA
jgi:hypothetical protein